MVSIQVGGSRATVGLGGSHYHNAAPKLIVGTARPIGTFFPQPARQIVSGWPVACRVDFA